MSHMVKNSNVIIKSLSTLKQACHAMGLEWKEGQTTATYWGGLAKGYIHAIGIKGVDWEIGVKQTSPGEYTLEADFYGTTGKVVRDTYNRLLQGYSTAEVKRQARLKGYRVRENHLKGGVVRLEVLV